VSDITATSMPTLGPTELFLWQVCQQYAREYPARERPVRSELVAAFVPRVVQLLVLRHVASDVLAGIDAAAEIFTAPQAAKTEAGRILEANFRELVSEIVELDSYLHEPGIDEVECGNWLTERGYSFQQASELMKNAKGYQAGRKPVKRKTAVDALEAKRLEQGRTWRSLVKEFCQCTKSDHDDLCIESLRKSVAQLESVLQKYQRVAVPAPMFAPLAEIFLDRIGWQHPR
jgi:hypothetical protein